MRVEKVRFRYPRGDHDVLRNVSLEVPDGRVTALLGPNGSGKTTLLKVLLKILTPQEGFIYIDGRDINEFSREELGKLLAWVPQEEEHPFPYTVLEYLLMGRAPYLGFFNLPTKEDVSKVVGILNRFGIVHLRDREISSLSGGEKRLALITRALAQEPETLLLDEPTAHLDLGNKARALRAIRGMADSGKTVLFSTHDPNEASLIADNVAMINGGRIARHGSPGRVMTKEALEAMYGTWVRLIKVDGKTLVDLSDELKAGHRPGNPS